MGCGGVEGCSELKRAATEVNGIACGAEIGIAADDEGSLVDIQAAGQAGVGAAEG